MIFNELPIAFPWYDQIEKQNRFRDNVGNLRAYGLISPYNALLPFQFIKNGIGTIEAWNIVSMTTGNIVATITPQSIAALLIVTRENNRYFIYDGSPIFTSGGPLDLPEGFYFSQMVFSDASQVFSEVFRIPSCPFAAGTQSQFLKIEWWNDTDLRPVFFNQFSGGRSVFVNTVYLDTFIHVSEPEIIEETEPDGQGEEIPTFQKAVIRYLITDMVPDFLKIALVLMQMHDHIIITTKNGIRSGEIRKLTTTSTPEQGGALATVEIRIEEELAAIKKGCADNMTP